MPVGAPIAQPATLPEWATGGGALITTPGPGTIASGAVPDTPAIAQYDNWKGKWTFKWLEWLKDIVHQALTWTGNHVFQGSATFSGAAIFPSAGSVDFQGSTDFTGVGSTHAIAGNVTIGGTLAVGAQPYVVPTLLNNWVHAVGKQKLVYWKDSLGTVHVSGYVTNTVTGSDHAGDPIFNLPAGYRPLAGQTWFPGIRLGSGTVESTRSLVQVESGGNVYIQKVDTGDTNIISGWISIAFRTDVPNGP